MKKDDYLVLRRAGALWGVSNAGVTAVHRGVDGVLIETPTGPLFADEALTITERLEVRRPGALLQHLAGSWAEGLAMYQGSCVAIVDPACPPEVLRAPGDFVRGAATRCETPATESTRDERMEGGKGDGTTGA